jgi:hypothetical protein
MAPLQGRSQLPGMAEGEKGEGEGEAAPLLGDDEEPIPPSPRSGSP